MKSLFTIVVFALFFAQGIWGELKDTPFSPRLFELASNADLDWLKESDQLIADGCDKGDVLEALISRFCITADIDCLVSMLHIFEGELLETPFGESRLFETKDLRDGFTFGLRAIDAYRWKRFDEMRDYARNCFELNPSAFNMLEIREVLEDARDEVLASVSTVKLPLDVRLQNIGGEPVTLGELCANNKAVFLDFWASWCGPCLRRMPDLKEKAAVYSELGIYIAAINTDSKDPVEKAKRIKQEYDMNIPWLIEPEDEPFSRALNIDSIPRVVMLDRQGKVIFNGHPDATELKILLLNLGVVQ